MGKNKTTSLAKRESNRENAARSSGPRTLEGKAVVRLNALKHGLLSKELVISQGDGKEDANEFATLLNDLCNELSPQGTIEEILVEIIARSYWRLRRVTRFEVGILRKRLDRVVADYKPQINWDDEKVNILTDYKSLVKAEKELMKGYESVITLLEGDLIIDKVTEAGDEIGIYFFYVRLIRSEFLTDASSINPELFVNRLTKFEITLEEMREFLLKNGWDDKKIRSSFIRQCVAGISRCKERIEELERRGRKAELKASRLIQTKSLPDALSMERIIRYENSIERQLYRALDQLERIQRKRAGEVVPPPLSVEIKTETE